MKYILFPALLIGCSISAFSSDTVETRLTEAESVLNDMAQMSDRGIPSGLLEKAQCVVVIPNLTKGGFIVGAKYGKGFISCRRGSGTSWSAPGSVRIEGGSFGLQIGVSGVDIILLVMNESGEQKLLQSKFTLGGNAGVAAGPVGRDSSAATDAQMGAEILSYSRARGVFAGLSLEGGTLRQDLDDNKALYGSSLSNKEILTGSTQAPPAAQAFVNTLSRVSKRKM